MIWKKNYFFLSVFILDNEREQNIPPQNVPLWYMDDFELKTIKTQQTQKVFYFSFNCLEEPRMGAYTRKRVITRGNFFIWDLSAGQNKHLFTNHLLFSSSLELSSSLKPQTPTIFISSAGCMFQLPVCLWVSYFQEAPVCKKLNLFSPINLLTSI